MRNKKFISLVLICILSLTFVSCAQHKIPVILQHPPEEPYDVIAPIEAKTEWHGLHWLWHWWHYMPWYPAITKVHDKKLIKEAQKLNADAIINIEYLPHRQGAKAEAIRFRQDEALK